VDFVAERGICLIWSLDFVNFGGFRLLAGHSHNWANNTVFCR